MVRRRFAVEDDGLEPLDPTTGLGIVDRRGADGGLEPEGTRARGRRLRRIRRMLVALALSALVSAAYSGWSIERVRRVERAWRTALAVDAVRARSDRLILSTLDGYGDDASVDSYLTAIGAAETSELLRAETSLENLRVTDGRLRAVRRQMITALQFRQRQMSPQRRTLGDTPLQRADAGLARQLHRWRLRPRAVVAPVLAEERQVRARLARFADEPTGTTLLALRGDELVMIDVDGSSIQNRPLPAPVDRLLAIEPKVVVAVGPSGVRAYDVTAPVSSPPLWERPDATAFAAPGATDLWLRKGTDVTRLAADGTVTAGPFTLPLGFEPVAAIDEGLVLLPLARTDNDDVFLWRPENGDRKLLATGIRRLIGSGRNLIVVGRRGLFAPNLATPPRDEDRVDVVSESGESIETIEVGAAIGAVAERPHHLEIAATGGPPAGPIASVIRYTLPGFVGVPGLRASGRDGSLAWAPSGEFLFWLTPAGSVAIHQPARRRQQPLRVQLSGLEAIVALDTPK